eukprot:scaffold260_cov115-Cylindrotheca_fusiformis.AAC.6
MSGAKDIENPKNKEEEEDVNMIRQRALALLERCGPTDSDNDVPDYEDDEEEDGENEEDEESASGYDDEELDPLVHAVRELSSSLETDVVRRSMTEDERRAHNDANVTTICALLLISIGVLAMYHLFLFALKDPR